MTIVWQEMKKIISMRRLLYMGAFFLLYYFLFLNPYVQSHYKTSYHADADMISSWIEEYGTELSPEEFQQMKSRQPEYKYDEIDEYIASNREFQKLGIHDFMEFANSQGGKGLTLEEENMLGLLLYDVFPDSQILEKYEELNTYNSWKYYMETYELETAGGSRGETLYYEDLNEEQRKRVEERSKKDVYGQVAYNVVYYNFDVLRVIGFFMALGMIFLILPYMVSENRSRMPALQYSFKKGRSCYGSRLAAVLFSCMLIGILAAAVYWKIAVINRVPEFWNCNISSYSTGYISWYSWTLGEYTIFHLLLAAFFSTGLSLGVFTVTHYLENYVTAIAWVLPAVIGSVVFCGFMLYAFGEITQPKGLIQLAGVVVAALGGLAAVLQDFREKRRDVGIF